MRYIVCSVRDMVADVYGTPYCSGSVGQAIRSFSDEVNRASDDNMLYKHAPDFELFQLGTFDDAQAEYDLLERPKSLILGRDAVVVKKG